MAGRRGRRVQEAALTLYCEKKEKGITPRSGIYLAWYGARQDRARRKEGGTDWRRRPFFPRRGKGERVAPDQDSRGCMSETLQKMTQKALQHCLKKGKEKGGREAALPPTNPANGLVVEGGGGSPARAGPGEGEERRGGRGEKTHSPAPSKQGPAKRWVLLLKGRGEQTSILGFCPIERKKGGGGNNSGVLLLGTGSLPQRGPAVRGKEGVGGAGCRTPNLSGWEGKGKGKRGGEAVSTIEANKIAADRQPSSLNNNKKGLRYFCDRTGEKKEKRKRSRYGPLMPNRKGAASCPPNPGKKRTPTANDLKKKKGFAV